MRRAHNLDSNHREVVDTLRAYGVWAHSTAGLGNGFPDVLACLSGVFVLLEVKDGALPPSKRELSPQEAAFFRGCPGPVFLVHTPDEALEAVRRAAGARP